MSPSDWENVARCAKERLIEKLQKGEPEQANVWWREWESWEAAQALSGRFPF